MSTHGRHSHGRKLLERPARVEASLWRRLRFEAEARCRELLFNLHLPFARTVARSEYRRRHQLGLEHGDFDQISFAALLEAIDRYDPVRGAAFQAFARPRLKGAIVDSLARASEVGTQYAYRRRIERERLRSMRAPGDSPPLDPLSELAHLATSLAIGFLAESASSKHTSDADGRASPIQAYESTAWRDLELTVLEQVRRLPAAERTVVEQHYCNGVEFTQIARLLGVSKGRVSQLHRSALVRMREALRRSD